MNATKIIKIIGITVNITIPEKSKEQDKNTETTIVLASSIGNISFKKEEPAKKTDVQNNEEPPKQQDENKSFY